MKYNGHVFAPLVQVLSTRCGITFPRGWSVRTRCRPDEDAKVSEVLEDFDSLHNRVQRKAGSAGARFCSSSARNALSQQLLRALAQKASDAASQVAESTIEGLKKVFDPFVVAPIDKLTGEAAVL